MQNLNDILQEVRKNPAKLKTKYLEKNGILDAINQRLPDENLLPKEKIDIILSGNVSKCYCGNTLKVGKTYCSVACVSNSPNVRRAIGQKNKANRISRVKKMKETLLKKYGVTAVQDIPSVKIKTKRNKQSYYDSVFEQTFVKYELDYTKYTDKEYLKSICENQSYHTISQKHFNGMPVMTLLRFLNRMNVDVSFAKSSSAGEKSVAEWIKKLGFNMLCNDRTVIKPKELDIYLPEKKLAIEFNGLYWHRNDKNLHKTKLDICKMNGITLIQIFEDEWYFNENIVKSIIKAKLGVIESTKKIDARKCIFSVVDSESARLFLEKNHLQGFINGKHFGLYHNDKLVSLFTVGKCRYYDGIELLRYATEMDHVVVGGFSKLLVNVKAYMSIESMYTYADMRYSDGAVYEKFGKFVKETAAGYFWFHGSNVKRISRYQTQKHKLKNLLGDKFDSALSEDENMTNAGYMKIYDAGHRLYLI